MSSWLSRQSHPEISPPVKEEDKRGDIRMVSIRYKQQETHLSVREWTHIILLLGNQDETVIINDIAVQIL